MAESLKTTLSTVLAPSGKDGADGEFVNIQGRIGVLGRIRLSLFAVLYLITKESYPTSIISHTLSSFITTVQLLYFCFDTRGDFAWPSEVGQYLLPVLKAFTFAFVLDVEPQVAIIMALVCCMLVGLFLIVSVLVACEFSSGGARTMWLLQPLRVFVNLSVGVLFVPMLIVTLNVVDCEGIVAVVVACDSSGYYALVGSCCFIALVFVSCAVFRVYVVYDRDSSGKSADSRVHGRVQCLSLLAKATIIVAFSLANQFQSEADGLFSRYALAITVLGSGVMMSLTTWFYLPYLRMEVNCLELGFACVFSSGGLCLIIAQLLNNGGRGVLYTFALTVPLSFYSGYSLANRRMRMLVACERDPDSVFSAEIMLRYRFPHSMPEWSERALPKYKELATGRWTSNAFLCLHIAHLSKNLAGNDILASQCMRKARTLSLPLDLRFIMFKHSLEVSAVQNGRGGFSYVAIDHHYRQAEENIVEALEGIVTFWKSQGRTESTAAKLFHHSNKVKRLAESARNHLDKLLELTNGSVRSIRLYAKFLKYILNDSWKAQELNDKADALEAEDLENGNEEDFFDTRNYAVAMLGGTDENMGEMLQVSDRFCNFFGYRRKQLVGNNINMLMPSPFAEVHSMWLKKHLETSTSTVAVSRKVWGLHRLGHVVPFDLHFKSGLDENDCIVFTGKVSLSLDHGKIFLVTKDDGSLLFASETAWRDILRRAPDTPCLSGRGIKTLVPELEALDLSTIHGIPQSFQIQYTAYDIEVTRMPYRSRNMDFIMVVFNQMDNFSEHSSAAEVIDAEIQTKISPKERFALTPFDAGSHVSGGTSASGSTVAGKQRNMYARLEKNVFKKTSSSSGFMKGCIVCTLLYLSLSVTKYALNGVKDDTYTRSFLQEYNAMLRSIQVLHLTFAVQLYVLPEYNSTMTATEAVELKAFMHESSKSLEQLHHKIESESVLRDVSVSNNLHDQLVRVTIDGTTYSNKSVFVAVQEFVNNVDSVVARSEGGDCSVACDYILSNGAASIASACLQSSKQYSKQTWQIEQLDNLIKVLYACAYFALTGILTVRYILPFAMKIFYTQENTAVALLNIPKTASSAILAKAQANLAKLKVDTGDLYNEVNKDTDESPANEAQTKAAEETWAAPHADTRLAVKKVDFDVSRNPNQERTKPISIDRKVSPGFSRVKKERTR